MDPLLNLAHSRLEEDRQANDLLYEEQVERIGRLEDDLTRARTRLGHLANIGRSIHAAQRALAATETVPSS